MPLEKEKEEPLPEQRRRELQHYLKLKRYRPVVLSLRQTLYVFLIR